MVYLLKFVNGKWEIVDCGVRSKVDEYTAQGYIVQYFK